MNQGPTIQQGATGKDVNRVQRLLVMVKLLDFGPQTKASVKGYQTHRNLTADGIVGDRTWWVPAGAAGATLASLSGLTTV